MLYNTNQNRQFYVVDKVSEEEPKALGEVKVGTTKDEKQMWFKHFGQGGLNRSDIIDVDNVCYAKITEADALKVPLKQATVKLSPDVNGGNPIVGEDYVLRIVIHNYLAPGDDHWTVKHGAVHAYAGMDATKFYEKLAKSLELNFSREIQPLLTFEASADGVLIKEVEQPWNLGHMAQLTVNFEVIATTVRYQGDDVVWAETDDEDFKIHLEDQPGKFTKEGYKIADLEWFCMGERGDQYRDNVPGVLRMPTKPMVDPEEEYDVLDIHYFFSDTGVNVQKSEKDITLVAKKGSEALTTIKSTLEGLGIKFKE